MNIKLRMKEYWFIVNNRYHREDDARVWEFDSPELIPESSDMADIMVKANIFDSKSQARKNGWNRPIPEGYSFFKAGKFKTEIEILNPTKANIGN